MGVMALFGMVMVIMLEIGKRLIAKENREKLSIDSEILPYSEVRMKVTIDEKVAEYVATVKRFGKNWRGSLKEVPELNAEKPTRVELIRHLESMLSAWYRQNKMS